MRIVACTILFLQCVALRQPLAVRAAEPAAALTAPAPAAAAELAARRARAREAMRRAGGEQAVLLLRSPSSDHFAGDVDYPYRPDDDLYYLTGLAHEGCALFLSVEPKAELGQEVLFFAPQPPGMAVWIGEGLTKERASEMSGIPAESVLPLADLKGRLARVLGGGARAGAAFVHAHGAPRKPGARLFFPAGGGFAPGEQPTEPYGFLIAALGSNAFHLDVREPAEILHPLRQVKSAAEIALMRKAIDATTTALVSAMRAARPGIHEYEIRGVIEGAFVREGCRGWGFPSIVATGPNTCILHYQDDRRRGEAGELLLMDIGAEYGYYSADVTRTVPLGGRFSPRQREVYALVLQAQERAIAAVKPGATLRDINGAARGALAAGLKKLGLIEKDEEVAKYSLHGVSHGLGLNVHDPLPIAELAPGMVVTVEPGVYIPAEGIGVRIEDDVLVTETGCEVLSAAAPKTIDAIEALMSQRAY